MIGLVFRLLLVHLSPSLMDKPGPVGFDLVLSDFAPLHLRTVSPLEDAARAWTGKSLKKQIWEVIEICSMQSFMFFLHQSPIHFMPMAHGWGTFWFLPCHVKPTQGEEGAEGTAFNLFLDLRWHSRALFQMTRSYAGDSDALSETLWVRVLSNDAEYFRWKGSEAGSSKKKHHPGLSSYMWSWHSRLHVCFVTSHCLTWSKVFSFCHWSSQLVLCFWPLPRFKQGTIFAAQQTWTIWAVPMVASTFIPGLESMRQWGLKPVWPNDFQKWSLRTFLEEAVLFRGFMARSLYLV